VQLAFQAYQERQAKIGVFRGFLKGDRYHEGDVTATTKSAASSNEFIPRSSNEPRPILIPVILAQPSAFRMEGAEIRKAH
jgi:hypothetical protein